MSDQVEVLKPLNIEMRVNKDSGKTQKFVVKRADPKVEGDVDVTEERPILLTQAEATTLALAKANASGYKNISLQNQTETAFQFLAYN